MAVSSKAGDTAEWGRGLHKRIEAVIDNAVNRMGAIRPKGGCDDLSRETIRWAIAAPNGSETFAFVLPENYSL